MMALRDESFSTAICIHIHTQHHLGRRRPDLRMLLEGSLSAGHNDSCMQWFGRVSTEDSPWLSACLVKAAGQISGWGPLNVRRSRWQMPSGT